MIKLEHIEVMGFEHTIRGMRAKGYRKTKTGYETFVSVKQKNVSLGTYKTEQDAINAVYEHRIKRFLNGVHSLKLDITKCKPFSKNYVIFSCGTVLNLHGEKMVGAINSGYHEVIINGIPERVHRIVALAFIENTQNKKCVNHKDGNKLNNNINNLEWCTHSENTLHSFKNGIQKTVSNQYGSKTPLSTEQKFQISKEYHKYTNKELAKKFNVCERTIRKYKEFSV